MWRRAGAAALVLTVAAALVLLGAGAASAAPELSLSPASGPAGTEIAVSGTGFASSEVEIRWAGPSGPLLASATGPDFSVTAVVPDQAANSYPVVAVVLDGTSLSTSNASFQVTPSPTTTTVESAVPTTSPEPSQEEATVSPRGGGVSGGIDPAMPGTVEEDPPASSDPVSASPAAAGAGEAATTTTAPPATTTTSAAAAMMTTPAEAPGAPGTAAPVATDGAGNPSAKNGDAARAPSPTSSSQSAGEVQSPVLLVAGLGLVLAGGLIMVVRNRRRLGS